MAGFAGVLCLLTLPVHGCALIGVEPDEIDYAASDTGGLTGDSLGMTEDEGNDDGVESETGETNEDDTGDGDGDGDGDPGDGDGDPGDGDGDGDAGACANLDPLSLADGPNEVELADGPSNFDPNQDMCSAPGPDVLYSYTATATGTVQFALNGADFDAVMYLVGSNCVPLDLLACGNPIEADVTEDETLYVIVDSAGAAGTATLDISYL